MTGGNYPRATSDDILEDDVNNIVCIQNIVCGENVTAGLCAYINTSDNKVYLSDTATTNDIRVTGIVLTTATSGSTTNIQFTGIYTTTGLTAGLNYYLGVNGSISTTISAVKVGYALSSTQLFLDIKQDDNDIIGTIKAFPKSFSGVPSTISAFWVECNGQVLSDAESPLNGQTIPDLNGSTGNKRFLRGSTTSGTTGGGTHNHQWGKSVTTSGDYITGDYSSGTGDKTVSYASNGSTLINFDANTTLRGDYYTKLAESNPYYYEVVFLMKVK